MTSICNESMVDNIAGKKYNKLTSQLHLSVHPGKPIVHTIGGGVFMATSSITKDFYVKDPRAFEKLKKELESGTERKQVVQSPSLEKGREKLATFVFR